MKKPKRIEGYWWSEAMPACILPIPHDKPWKGKRDFLEALDAIEEEYNEDERAAKGSSRCRICGIKNGSVTYKVTGKKYIWSWPEGFRHYVYAHNVKPSSYFIRFILAKDKRIQRDMGDQ